MHTEPLNRAVQSAANSTKSSKLSGSEWVTIARYLQKSEKVTVLEQEEKQGVQEPKIQKEQNSSRVEDLNKSIEQKSSKVKELDKGIEKNRSKRLRFTIESILKSEKNSSVTKEDRESLEVLAGKKSTMQQIEVESNVTQVASEENGSSVDMVKESEENYTIYGELMLPQIPKIKKSQKKQTLPSLAKKSLWLKAKKEPLKVALKRVGARVGDPIFIRIFKKNSELEVWIKPKKSSRYKLLKIYGICKYSGGLGPKLMQGDKKSPEGFYSVNYSALNPHSNYHLSFNLGFPNLYDRYHGYTGSYLMVHGKCKSVGCYAMGDRNIDDIYMLVEKALLNGQLSVSVHIFPFRMTKINLARHKKSRWYKFWLNLKEGYDAFEKSHRVPTIEVVNGRYNVVDGGGWRVKN